MRINNENEQGITSCQHSEEFPDEFRSPPRIRRLKGSFGDDGINECVSCYISDTSDEESVHLPCHQDLHSMIDSRRLKDSFGDDAINERGSYISDTSEEESVHLPCHQYLHPVTDSRRLMDSLADDAINERGSHISDTGDEESVHLPYHQDLHSMPASRQLKDSLGDDGINDRGSYVSDTSDEESVHLPCQQDLHSIAVARLLKDSLGDEINESGNYVSDTSDGESVHLPCQPDLHSSTDSRSPPSMEFSPPSLWPRTDLNITDFRRRLEVIKERRAKIRVKKHNCGNPLAIDIRQHELSATMSDGASESPQEASMFEVFELLTSFTDCSESTCSTFDEITMDITTDSRQSLPNSPNGQQLLSSRPSICSLRSIPDASSFTLQRLVCASPQKILASDSPQIEDVIRKTTRTSAMSENNEKCNSREMNLIGNSYNHTWTEGRELSENSVSSITSPIKTHKVGTVDQLLCTRPRLPRDEQLEFLLPKAKSRSSFQEHSRQRDFSDRLAACGISDPSRTSSRIRQSSQNGLPTLLQLPLENLDHTSSYRLIGSGDAKKEQQEQQRRVTGTNRSRPTLLRKASSFSWFRRDPWYLRPASVGGASDQTVADLSYTTSENTSTEKKDRMMHAVVFVTK